jgi:hypothetical protein
LRTSGRVGDANLLAGAIDHRAEGGLFAPEAGAVANGLEELESSTARDTCALPTVAGAPLVEITRHAAMAFHL